MKKIFAAVFILVLMLISGTSLQAKDYVVGIGDILKVNVYDHADLTTVARIDGDGQILFPLLGQIKVAGLTVAQVSKKISDLLSDGYIVAPQVTVFVEEFRSQKATIMGQVNRPGLYELKGYTTFLEILSKAGDLAKDAGDKAIIKRKPETPDKAEQTITVDLRSLTKGDSSQDVQILDGDSIYVVKAGVFYVTGEVKKPDSYKFEEGTTVLKAVTTAGGFSDKASTGRVKIIRKEGDAEKVLPRVKMDEPVFPGDVIVVPESFF
ncbi:MAG TPA: SLBB domain-containing protein [Dissulfurispiraceae bacterium]|nr:SLBB domain-containing protein [Dissulfurispiraceae bacterium]